LAGVVNESVNCQTVIDVSSNFLKVERMLIELVVGVIVVCVSAYPLLLNTTVEPLKLYVPTNSAFNPATESATRPSGVSGGVVPNQ
jgi:hypothetical protein